MMMSSDLGEVVVPRKRKKGVRNEEKYQRNVIRQARLKGLAYQSYLGKEVSAKVQQTYNCKCAQRCYSNISEENKKDLWNDFHSLDNKNMQDTYLQSLIEKREPKKRRSNKKQKLSDVLQSDEEEKTLEDKGHSNVTSKRKKKFFSYNIKIDGKLRIVCKNAFMTLHGVSRERIRRVCDALIAGKTPRDMRGLTPKDYIISKDISSKMHDHISRYPVKQTHHGGNLKNYLNAKLNIVIMHEMFLKEHPECENKVKLSTYGQYFMENFDYSFGRPQSADVCSKCESFSVKMKDPTLSDSAKRKIAAKQMLHIWHANKFHTALNAATDNLDDDTVAIAFGFMQNQALPRIPVQEMFYLNQLMLNVFSIHDLKSKKSDLYLYHEGVANKSADEVCSFLLHYLRSLPSTVTKLLLFSVGFSSHHNNNTIIRFLISLCDGRFESIRHFLPFSGHLNHPCNQDFTCLKQCINNSGCIYTPEQYGELFLNAGSSGQFTVHYVKTDDILDFKAWWPAHYKKSTFSDVTKGKRASTADQREKFTISSYKEFHYSRQKKGKVVCKEFISSLQERTFTLGKTRKSPVLPSAKAYPEGRVAINEKKIQDLISLQDHFYGYESFYNEIFNWPCVNVTVAHMFALDSDFTDDEA